MSSIGHEAHSKSQSDTLKDAFGEAECDEDEAHWTAKLKKIATQEPEKPE